MAKEVNVRMGIYRHVLRAAHHFCAVDEHKPSMNGIHLLQDDGDVIVTATNGFALFRSQNGGEIHEGTLPENGIILHRSYVKDNLKGKVVMEKVDLFHYTNPPKTLRNGDEEEVLLIDDRFPDVHSIMSIVHKNTKKVTGPLTQWLGLNALGMITTALSDFHGGKQKYTGGSSNHFRSLKFNFSGELRATSIRTRSTEGTKALVLLMPDIPD